MRIINSLNMLRKSAYSTPSQCINFAFTEPIQANLLQRVRRSYSAHVRCICVQRSLSHFHLQHVLSTCSSCQINLYTLTALLQCIYNTYSKCSRRLHGTYTYMYGEIYSRFMTHLQHVCHHIHILKPSSSIFN